jgi:DNA-directed RNA polymerase specialized sigma24 family protein
MATHGDEADLFAAHHARLHRQLVSRLGGEHDIAEEACTLAWVQLLRLQPQRSDTLGGWLYVTAKHEAYRILQQRAREDGGGVAVGGESAPRAPDPFEALTHRDRLALMGHLSAPQRLTVSLRAAGYSYKEISAATGRTYTWVNRHLTEGTAKLQQLATQDE